MLQEETTTRHARDETRPLPPPRPGVRHVKVPFAPVIVADDSLRRRVNYFFHRPMIILSLFFLPIIAIDMYMLYIRKHNIDVEGGMLAMIAWITYIAISTAFLIEFVVKITIAESRLEYCRRNWLDIIIIVLPFLRPLRLAMIAKSTRVFSLRGVGMKCARYVFTIVIGLEATERLLHRLGLRSKKGRTAPGQMTRHELMREIRTLRRLTEAWEDWYQQHQAYDALHNRRSFTEPPPVEDTGMEAAGESAACE